MSLLKGQVEVLHQNGDQKGILAFEPFGCSLVSFVLLGKMHCVVLGYQGKFLNILKYFGVKWMRPNCFHTVTQQLKI